MTPWRRVWFALAALIVLGIALVLGSNTGTIVAQQQTPTATAAKTATVTVTRIVSATATPVPTIPAGPPQQITVDSPTEGTVVGSPVTIVGHTARYPRNGALGYRVVDGAQQSIGSGEFAVSGSPGSPASFVVSLSFTLPSGGGPIRLDLFDHDDSGAEIAPVSWNLFVARPQAIIIDSPPSGTQVGSPVVITGRTEQLPSQAQLVYRITGSKGEEYGTGSFPLAGSPGMPAFFNASITFNAPLEGDSIQLELRDQNSTTGAVVASTTLPLTVLPTPQQITIDSPPEYAYVGTPVVLTGRTARYPFQGVLGYAIYESSGAQVSGGIFPVQGSPQTGGSFTTSITFNYPPQGGPLRIDLYDQDTSTGQFRATTSLNLRTVPLQQSIVIESPGSGTIVGIPMTITGSTARYPNNGVLQYRVLENSGRVLGSGSIYVEGAFGEPTRFTSSISYAAPASTSGIRVEVFETNAQGNTTASASVSLSYTVAPPPLTGQIIIETPAPYTIVGSPMTITGRTTFIPPNGSLSYRVRDSVGNNLGTGSIQVQQQGSGTRFVASISYTPTTMGSPIYLDIFSPDSSNGNLISIATIQLQQG